MMHEAPTIVIVDDHPGFRAFARRLLEASLAHRWVIVTACAIVIASVLGLVNIAELRRYWA